MSIQRTVIFTVVFIVNVSCSQSTGFEDFRKYRTRYEAAIVNARELANLKTYNLLKFPSIYTALNTYRFDFFCQKFFKNLFRKSWNFVFQMNQ